MNCRYRPRAFRKALNCCASSATFGVMEILASGRPSWRMASSRWLPSPMNGRPALSTLMLRASRWPSRLIWDARSSTLEGLVGLPRRTPLSLSVGTDTPALSKSAPNRPDFKSCSKAVMSPGAKGISPLSMSSWRIVPAKSRAGRSVGRISCGPGPAGAGIRASESKSPMHRSIH